MHENDILFLSPLLDHIALRQRWMPPPSRRRRRRPPASPHFASFLVFAILVSFVKAQLCSNTAYPSLSNNLCCVSTPSGCTVTPGSVVSTGVSDPAKNQFVCSYGAAGTYTLAVPSSTTLLVDVVGGNGIDGVLLSTGGAGGRISGYINSGTTYASTGMVIMVGAGSERPVATHRLEKEQEWVRDSRLSAELTDFRFCS